MNRSLRPPDTAASTTGELLDVVDALPLPTLVTCEPPATSSPPVRASASLLELLGVDAPAIADGLASFTITRDAPDRLREAAARSLDTGSTVIVRGLRLRRRDEVFVADVHLRAFVSGRVTGVVSTVVDRSLDRELIGTLENRANFDPLTGLLRREAMLDRIDRSNDVRTEEAGSGHVTAAIFCDLNDLKAVNDRLGHHAGDALIAAMAGRLERSIRSDDLASRWGGDEFVVWARAVPDVATAVALAERIRSHTRGTAVVGGKAVAASMAVGVAVTTDELEPLALIDLADAAMYRSKHERESPVAVTMVPRSSSPG